MVMSVCWSQSAQRRGFKAWVRLRAILGLVIFPILGNLLRLGSERLVAYMDEHVDAHLSSSAYPDVLANMGGCLLLGAMYESRAFFEDKLPGALTFPDVPDATSVYVAISTWLCGSITTYSSLNSVVAKRTLDSSFWYGLLTGLIGAATSYMALLAGMDLASGFARMQSLPPPPPSTIAPTLPRAAPSITTPAAAAPELQSCDTAAAAGLDASPTTGGRLLLPEEMDMGEVYEAGRGNVFREVEMRRSASSLRAAATAAAAAGKGSVVGSMVSKEGGGEEEGGGVGVVVGVEGGGVGDGKGVSQGEAGEEEHYSVLVYTKPSGRQVAIMVEIGMYFVATAALLALVVVAVQQFETRRDDPLWLSCLFAPLGAALRYALALWMARSAKTRPLLARFPLQTFTANILGSTVSALTIVAVAICKARGDWLRAHYYDAVGKGFCGCLSTYSTFALELHKLPTREAWRYALVSFVASQAIALAVLGSHKAEAW